MFLIILELPILIILMYYFSRGQLSHFSIIKAFIYRITKSKWDFLHRSAALYVILNSERKNYFVQNYTEQKSRKKRFVFFLFCDTVLIQLIYKTSEQLRHATEGQKECICRESWHSPGWQSIVSNLQNIQTSPW